MSIRSLKIIYMVLHLVQELLSVFKPDGQPLVLVNLNKMVDVAAAAAAVLIMEQISRILLRDNEFHQVSKDSHIFQNQLQFILRQFSNSQV